ncbi:LysE family transporter [Deinococcus sp.]|uniref:LysE family transporter n=1 Tax=Deinococcus sp. TaxID=47478 RepID=UPI0025C25E0A|nr:LysE family transporter [Deinococcus sp.]
MGVLFQAFPWIHTAIKVAGGLYLLWMGVNLWRSSLQEGGEGHPVALPMSDLAALRTGFLTNISNPKAAVFFGSVFSSLLGAGATPGLKLGAWLIVFGLGVLWFTLVAFGLSTAPVQNAYLRARKTIDRVGGTVMLGFGGLLLARE